MKYAWIFLIFGLDMGNIWEYFCRLLSVPQNIVMDLNKVMSSPINKSYILELLTTSKMII